MKQSLDQVAVCIRSVGERTEAICRKLVMAEGIAANAIRTIAVQPFSSALRMSYEYGLEMNYRWTACVDADVLVRSGCIRQMLGMAERQGPKVFEIQGMVLDKFFGGPRHGGIHFYRTELFAEALKHIPTQASEVRPEARTLRSMAERGYPWQSIPYVVGLHDFEQYYSDIFRKSFVHAHKHPHLINYFVSFWRANATSDEDYRVALAGLSQGIRHCGDIRIDASCEIFKVDPSSLLFQEKTVIEPDEWSGSRVEDILRDWREPQEFRLHFWSRMTFSKWRSTMLEFGLFRSTLLFTSSIFAALGRYLYRLSVR